MASRVPQSGRRALAILAAALLVKVVLLVLFEHRLYGDVIQAVNFGREHHADPSRYLITSKTYVGPVAWYSMYHHVGVRGLKLLNIVLFVAAFGLQRRFGRGVFSDDAVAIALVLFAFYPGADLTVVAGEQDDLVTLLLFALGTHVYVRREAAFLAGLAMGLAFLFKFTAAIFFAGFALHLVLTRRPRALLVASIAMALPFLLLNLTDHFDSTRNLFFATGLQRGFSTWPAVGFKLLSTGLLATVILSWWAYSSDGGRTTLLCCLLPSAYLAYVLLNRDAFSAGYVMMQGMWFAGFPLALLLLRARRLAIGAVLAGYVVVATAIAYHNLAHDTFDVRDPNAPLVLQE
jgi:hypothetical protein